MYQSAFKTFFGNRTNNTQEQTARSFPDLSWAKQGFLSCVLFIVSVSIYDSYLVVLYKSQILVDERNPICEMLIRIDPNSLSWFLSGKFMGNVMVIGTLMLLRWLRYSQTMTIATSVAAFQLALLVYLTFSDEQTGFLHFDGLVSNKPELFNQAVISLAVHLMAVISITIVAIGVRWKCTARKNLDEFHRFADA